MKKRRAHGEGNIYQRPDGTWAGRLTMGRNEQGRQRRAWVYSKTKAEVVEKLDKLKGERSSGTWVEPSRLTLAVFMTRWLEDRRSNIEESTYRTYRSALKHVAEIGGTRLEHLTPLAVQGVFTDLEREGVGPYAREVVYRFLHAALTYAEDVGLIRRHPMKGISKPRGPHREMVSLTGEQAQKFLEAAAQDRYHAAYSIMLGCGLRLGEVLGLTWPDVDLDKGTLTVRRQLSGITRRLKQLKTRGSQRTVQMPASVIEALREHQARMRAEGHEITDNLLVFVGKEGQPISQGNFRKRSFHKLLTKVGFAITSRKQGVRGIRIHDLRHSMATIARHQGVDILVLSRSLGHSKPSTTLNVYSHVLPAMAAEEAEKMDAALKPKPKD